MKKNIFFALLLIISATSFSQQTNSSKPITKADYMQKSKSQKGIAWLLLGGGTAVLVITTLSNFSIDFTGPKEKFPIVPVGIGAVCIAGSVPLFIASGRNKRKSMSLSFKKQIIPQIQNSSFVYKSLPSLNLKISL